MKKHITEIPRDTRVKFSSISSGDCFLFYGALYMKRKEGESLESYALDLSTGESRMFSSSNFVVPVASLDIGYTL